MSLSATRAPQPTDAQLETMFHLMNDYDGRLVGDIMRDVWNYVVAEIEAQRKEDKI